MLPSLLVSFVSPTSTTASSHQHNTISFRQLEQYTPLRHPTPKHPSNHNALLSHSTWYSPQLWLFRSLRDLLSNVSFKLRRTPISWAQSYPSLTVNLTSDATSSSILRLTFLPGPVKVGFATRTPHTIPPAPAPPLYRSTVAKQARCGPYMAYYEGAQVGYDNDFLLQLCLRFHATHHGGCLILFISQTHT